MMYVPVIILNSRVVCVACESQIHWSVFLSSSFSVASVEVVGTMTTHFMDPPQEILEGMTSMGHPMSIAGMPGVLQPHDEGYPGPRAEAFLLALGATVDTPIELHAASSQADAHAEIDLIQIFDNGAMRRLTYTEKGMCKMVDRYIRLRFGLIERIGTQPSGCGGC